MTASAPPPSCPYPGGLGPWMVALVFNLSGTEKKHKKTQVVAHTHVQLMVDRMNRAGNAANRWVIVAMHGVFESWRACVAYLHEWDTGARGPGKRLEHSVTLFLQYTLGLRLSMWVERRPRDAVLEGWEADRRRRVAALAASSSSVAAADGNIVVLDELEELFCGKRGLYADGDDDDDNARRPCIATMKRLCLHKEKKKQQQLNNAVVAAAVTL